MTRKKYYRIMLGPKSKYAEECFQGGFIGVDYSMAIDFTRELPADWREFNRKYIPVYLEKNPDKSKISAGLCCGMLWTVAKGLIIGDTIICPDGKGVYWVGEIASDYLYRPGEILPHRRKVSWLSQKILRVEMSQGLQNSTGSTGTVCDITKHFEEIERLISGRQINPIVPNDETIEDISEFAMEKHLEDFLVKNWKQTALGKCYDVFEDGDMFGQQFQTDTGSIDILAVSKDKKTLLVVELKKGRASDVVIGQIQRYMGYVKEELLQKDQRVKGVIIAFEDDIRLRRALSVANNIEFYSYKVRFSLEKIL